MIWKPPESDWKLFRARVHEWRERYLSIKNREIARLLAAEGKTPTEQFWETKDRMDEIARTLRTCLDGHSRSKMDLYLLLMLRHGLIDEADLDEFSDDVRERVLGPSYD